MSANQATNPFDLLGQTPQEVSPVELAGQSAPVLEIGWGEYRQSLASVLGALVRGPSAPRDSLSASFFRDSWIERRIPRRALIAAALWHLAFLALPLPQFSAPKRNPAFDNTELTWSGPIEDLPLVNLPAERPKAPRNEPAKPPQQESADAFHPRQRIFTDTAHPTHPRQTLINPAAPPVAPKFLPSLPNVVQLAQMQAPPRPHIEINMEALRNLHPREHRAARLAAAAAPNLQTGPQSPADFTLAMQQQNQPTRPKLELNAGAAPIVARRQESTSAEPAPEVAPSQTAAANGAASTFIALSATPGPPAPVVQPPPGNLAARVSISPEGKRGAAGGSPSAPTAEKGASGGDSGRNPVGVSISGGNPLPGHNVSGLGSIKPKLDLSASNRTFAPPDSDASVEAPPVRSGPPNFSDLPPGAKPEQIFGPKRVYKMRIDMPNLNSATGSWILSFSELGSYSATGRTASNNEINGPEPLRKVDPKYPPTLIDEHVEGEVVLYAVIRKDGSVDSIQLVHGIDAQLDANAMHALSQWKFRPATKQGEPVDLEAIVHIPFRAPSFR